MEIFVIIVIAILFAFYIRGKFYSLTLKIKHIMSEVNDQVQAATDKIAASLVKIRTDIQTLTAQINPGGLTAEEAQALVVKLNGIVGDAQSIDDLTADPAPATEPTV